MDNKNTPLAMVVEVKHCCENKAGRGPIGRSGETLTAGNAMEGKTRRGRQSRYSHSVFIEELL
jgi:hypothetical protein